MRIRELGAAAVLAITMSSSAAAATPENFTARSSQDLLDLCSTPSGDPLYREAIHFCHGYVVGAYHYLRAATSGPGASPLACVPEPPPSRNAAIAQFTEWMGRHPQFMQELPAETLLRYLQATYPCPR